MFPDATEAYKDAIAPQNEDEDEEEDEGDA
jgi:hypothetical protein